MKIAQFTKYFHPHRGGIESNVLGISEGLVKRGHKVLVFTSNTPATKKKDTINGIEVYRGTPILTLFNDPIFPGILTSMLKEDYDLIHLHLPDPFTSILALLASMLKNKEIIVTYHADILKNRWYHKPFELLYLPIQNLVLKKARKIIATSPNYAQESNVLKKYQDKLEVIPNFIDTSHFNPDVDGRRIKEKYN
ncbi:MAG: glycosyltransferase, partial [Candidatus Altiarchaeales archaeon]|nr:glycosyltransferase [Candidatus Altiarchaeales archaeon]